MMLPGHTFQKALRLHLAERCARQPLYADRQRTFEPIHRVARPGNGPALAEFSILRLSTLRSGWGNLHG